MATHSSILSWEIPWAEKPGGLQSMGLQSVGQLSDQRTTSMLKIQILCICGRKEGANPCVSITGIDFYVWLVAIS